MNRVRASGSSSAGLIYAGLAVGALVTLVPFLLGLLTSVTSAHQFATDLPLWPGSNMVTVVARENNDVRSVKTVYVYKDAPRTAATP